MIAKAQVSFAALALALLVAGCGGSATPPKAPPATGGPWEARLDAVHPLVGKLWDGTSYISLETLAERVRAANVVVVGEKHDHPDHHRLQARVVKMMVRDRRAPSVLLEMVDADEQPALDAAWAKGLDAFPTEIGWEKRGWPAFAIYRPVFELAQEAGLPLVAANLPRAQARTIAREGLSALDPALVTALGLDKPLAADARVALEAEIADAHCGHLPKNLLPTMADAQRARDARMAAKLVEVARDAVLVTGNGHARTDRGVPAHFRARKPDAKVLSVAFVEARSGKDEPGQYGEAWGAPAPPFDVVWFTPRLDDADPCLAFKR